MEIDRKTLKALAADTRLDILKSLGKRRKTPSELSKELNLAASTVIEHLNKLEEAGLIRKEETGHKWIYYNLTQKGSSLVKPKVPTQFIIVLSLCIFVVIVGSLYYYANYTSYAGISRPDMLTVPLSEKTTQAEETRMPEQSTEIPATAAGTEGNMTNVTNVTNSTNQTIT
jgi:DNA-binding transcriptional ArsR family regulator